jgi:hypothetical protein
MCKKHKKINLINWINPPHLLKSLGEEEHALILFPTKNLMLTRSIIFQL